MKECPDKYKLIREKGKCIDYYSKDNLYIFEYNGVCYSTYPEITITVSTSINSDTYEFYSKSNIPTIIPNNTEIFEIELSTNIANETSVIYDKDKTVVLSTYISYETIVINNLINKCTTYELLCGLCKLESNYYDAMASILRELILEGGIDSIVLNMANKNNKGVVIKGDSTVYQIITTDNQKNIREDNISIVELGECEIDLRNHHNISKKDSLLIFKIDIYKEGSLTPRIEYEVYDSKTKVHLDLRICNHTKIFSPSINRKRRY